MTRANAQRVSRIPATLRVVFAAFAALSIAGTPASAQGPIGGRTDRLDSAIVTAPNNLNADQMRTLRSYASFYSEQLRTGNVRERQEARRKLIEPFELNETPAARFRFDFTDELAAPLGALARGDDLHRASQAIYVLGYLATERSSDVLTDVLVNAESPAKRYAAAQALGTTLLQLARGQGVAIPQQPAQRLVVTIAGRLTDEENPVIAGRLADSMRPLVNPPRGAANATYRNLALRAMCERAAERLSDGRENASGLGTERMISSVLDTAIESARVVSNEDVIRAVALLGGEVLAHLDALAAENQGVFDTDRALYAAIASNADRLVQRARSDLVGEAEEAVGGRFMRADDPREPVDVDGFRARVGRVIEQLSSDLGIRIERAGG